MGWRPGQPIFASGLYLKVRGFNGISPGYSGQIRVTAEPFQRLTVCAHSVSSEDAVVAVTVTENHYILMLQSKEASVNIIASEPCLQSHQDKENQQYSWQGFLFSNAPFMVRISGVTSQEAPDHQNTDFFLPSVSPSDFPKSVDLLSTLGGSMDRDDSFKRPPFMPISLSQIPNLTYPFQ